MSDEWIRVILSDDTSAYAEEEVSLKKDETLIDRLRRYLAKDDPRFNTEDIPLINVSELDYQDDDDCNFKRVVAYQPDEDGIEIARIEAFIS